MNMNNFGIVTGRLTRDIELRTNEAGNTRGYISVAVRRNRKNNEGNYDTDFISFSVFGESANFIEKHFKKGDGIQVMFTVRPYTEEVKEGDKTVTKSRIGLNVVEVGFPPILNKKKAEADDSTEAPNFAPAAEAPSFEELADDDDLPF